jgi:hypothetical protein
MSCQQTSCRGSGSRSDEGGSKGEARGDADPRGFRGPPPHATPNATCARARTKKAAGARQSCWSSAALNPRPRRATPRSACSSRAAEIELKLAEGARDAATSGAMPPFPNEGRTGRACAPSWCRASRGPMPGDCESPRNRPSLRALRCVFGGLGLVFCLLVGSGIPQRAAVAAQAAPAAAQAPPAVVPVPPAVDPAPPASAPAAAPAPAAPFTGGILSVRRAALTTRPMSTWV